MMISFLVSGFFLIFPLFKGFNLFLHKIFDFFLIKFSNLKASLFELKVYSAHEVGLNGLSLVISKYCHSEIKIIRNIFKYIINSYIKI